MNNSAGVIDLSKYEQTKPFMAEYAKSSLSVCKTCNNNIIQGELRLASRWEYGKTMKVYHHLNCIFQLISIHPKSHLEIQNFEKLKVDDQQRINSLILPNQDENFTGCNPQIHLLIYSIECAKTGRGQCQHCLMFIPMGGIKIAKRVYYDANVAAKFNKPPFANRWYHANCLKIFDEPVMGLLDQISGFQDLSTEDKNKLLILGAQQPAAVLVNPKKEKRDAELENSRFSSTPVKKIKLEECVQVKVEPGLLPESTIKTEMVQIKSEIPDDLKFEFPDNVDVKPFKTEFKLEAINTFPDDQAPYDAIAGRSGALKNE